MQQDMTAGSPVKAILMFTVPIFVGNVFQQFYSMVDTIIVGKFVGTTALAAVGSVGTIMFLIIGFMLGLTAGFTVLTAQRFGAGDMKGMRKTVGSAATLSVIMTVIMTTISMLGMKPLLKFMNTPSDIFKDAYGYIMIICGGIFAQVLYNILASILRALGNSKTPLYFLILAAVLNIVLDLVFIIVFHMGVAGAAWATVTAQGISGLLCLAYIIKCVPELRLCRDDWKFRWELSRKEIEVGIPMGLQFSITAIGSMVMQSANNGLGSIYVSGFTAGMRIKQFAMCPFDALANGVSVFCSQNLGAGKIKRIRKGLWQGVGVGFIYGLLIGLVLIFAGRSLSMLFISADQTAVLDASAKYLRCLGFFYWSLGPLSVFRMSAQGMGFSGRAIFSGVTEMIARTFVSFAFVGTYGFTAICFADQTAWVSATLYITPVCLMCLRQVTREHERQQAKIAD